MPCLSLPHDQTLIWLCAIPNVKWKPSGRTAMFTFWFQVSCGDFQTVALTEAGKLYAWGDNDNGQLLQADNPSPTARQLDLAGKMYVHLLLDKYDLGFDVFSCDQAALWMVQSVRLSVRLSVCPSVTLFSCDQAALQLEFSVCPSVCPYVRLSVRLSHLFHHVPIIVSSWNFQELLPWSKVMSMQKVKVRGQRSRSQRSTPNLAVSGL